MEQYDCLIIGGGPAGLTAAIYLRRANLSVKIFEKGTIGGQITSATKVENYPGFKSISGMELANLMYEQAENLGAELDIEEVQSIDVEGPTKIVKTDSGTYEAKALIIATGSRYKTLDIENESKLIGHGISFCVSCDQAFFKDKVVAVIGGRNSACGNALSLSETSKKVYIIYRGSELACEDITKNKIKAKDNIEVIYNANVTKFLGEEELTGVVIKDNEKEYELPLDGVFEAIGMTPGNEGLSALEIDESKYIVAPDTITSIPGVYVAGDCRQKQVRQLTTATSDGTIAAINAIKYIRG